MGGKTSTESKWKYNSKTYERIALNIRTDSKLNKATIQEAANKAGMAVNAYILQAVAEKMERDNQQSPNEPNR